MFVKITNGQAIPNYTIGDLRKDYPNVSFPRNLSDDVLATYSVFRVTEVPAPEYNARTHRLVTQAPAMVNGVWTVTRAVVAKDQSQINNETAQVAVNVRAERNKLIAACDWTQVADSPVDKEVWATYRQALRDVPDQEGFPWDVIWPEMA